MSHCLINPEGKRIRVKTLKDMVEVSGLPYRTVDALSCGYRKSLRGWCSTHPKAKKRREKFLTKLINTADGKLYVLGQHPKRFAETHGLCANTLCQLLNGQRIVYKGWMLEKTHLALTATNF